MVAHNLPCRLASEEKQVEKDSNTVFLGELGVC